MTRPGIDGRAWTSSAESPACPIVGLVADAGWRRVGEVDGIPLWQWQEDQMVRVATYDHDVLRTIGAALNYHDTASLADSHAFITAHLLGGRSGTPSDGPLGIVIAEP